MPADAPTAVRLLTKGGVICQQTNELDSLTPAEQGGALDGERVLRIDHAVGRTHRARHIGAGAHPREIAPPVVPAVRDVVGDLDVQRYPSGTVRRALAGADDSTAVRLLTKVEVICQHPHFYWQSRQAASHLAGK